MVIGVVKWDMGKEILHADLITNLGVPVII